MATALEKILPPKEISPEKKKLVFTLFYRRLAHYRNTVTWCSNPDPFLRDDSNAEQRQTTFESQINIWAQSLLEEAWIVCYGEENGTNDIYEACPTLDPLSDTATGDLREAEIMEDMSKLLNTIVFLDITNSKQYSAYTRVFLKSLGKLDEVAIVSTLRNPKKTLEQAQKQVEVTRSDHAEQGRTLRVVGMGIGAIAGGILIGITGGLAAPLVGAGVATVLGWLGLGGSLVGLLASALAGSSVVCGALFGIYGAQSTANMVERHTKEVRDLALVPVGKSNGYDTLGIRIYVSGWLTSKDDVTAPWTSIISMDDTLALQWEIQALEDLSDALMTLVKSHAMKYVQAEVIKRTIFASLMTSLSPIAWLKMGQIIDNPWMNARALAIKAGVVLGDLLANRAFGNRPVTLAGYSLGSLVIFEALKHLASLDPSKSVHLIEDVFLFGTPVKAETDAWISVRRVVAGRLVNGYAQNDYVLGVLSRLSDATWEVAGLQKVKVKGVENICCEAVEGHTMWRTAVGRYLASADMEESERHTKNRF